MRDEKLFRSWMEEHRGILVKVARSFAATPEDRDDLIQEFLASLWSAMPSFRSQSKVSTWIYRVALNRALTWKRDESRRRKPLVRLVEVVDTGETTSSTLLNLLYTEIRELNQIDRSLVLMSLDGCTYSEMSQVMGISESNVGVRLNRAKKKLSTRMLEHKDER